MYTVTFDLDGTIFRSPFWRLHLRPWLELLSHQGRGEWWDLWTKIRDLGTRKWQRGDWVGAFDWNAIILEALGEVLPRPEVPLWAAVKPLLMPYVSETLLSLTEIGVDYAIVTNGFYSYQAPYLEALGLERWFHHIVTPDRVGAAKPDPRVFSQLGPVLCHIGDRPEHDAVAAKRAGIVSIQMGPAPSVPDRPDFLAAAVTPDITVDDFRSLPTVIKGLLRAQTGVLRSRHGEVALP